MMTSSAKRTLTGLVFNLAFLAALMNADLGDFGKERKKNTKQKIKGQSLSLRMSHAFFLFLFFFLNCSQFKDVTTLENMTPITSLLSADAIKGGSM